MPTRRRLLAGLAGGAVVGTVLGTSVSLGAIDSWTPATDSWPLRRFDPANTASNRAVSAPVAPSIAWRESVLARSDSNTLVVGPDRVYAGTDAGPSGALQAVVALDRADGSHHWTADTDTGSLALFDGRLYAGPADDDLGALEIYDAATGEQVGEAETFGVGERGHLVPTPDGVFLGAGNVLTGREHGGAARWRRASHGQGVPAVADGSLYAVGYDAARYDSRTLSDVPTGEPPASAWRTSYDSLLTSLPAAVVDGTLLAPGAVPTASPDFDEDPPAPLVGIDAETGALDWRAFTDGARRPGAESDGGDADPSGVVRTTALATDGQRVYAGISSGEQSTRRHAVGWVSVDSGDQSFLLSSDDWIADLAVVGKPDGEVGTDTETAGPNEDPVLLVGTAGDWANDEPTQAGTVRAVDATRGEELWRVRVRSAVRALAPVADAVFAVLLDGSVVKLSDAESAAQK
ncbi:PQQ-binding-like beta-propeller repeat protein [Salinirubrum litoreum]|uniref:PQQ-binding-like beta-propeller repeat protein n=1 Tax=Salinirubrum litoreum TaxID=1126234 RepID=A0ABD5R7G3_9EURY|nr:PQQ-binding-like beta-propeller repeat protein [Salinirubrum litoreum]